MQHLIEAIPATVKGIAVLDRTKEPGAAGEPLFRRCAHRHLHENRIEQCNCPSGRPERGQRSLRDSPSKEFTPPNGQTAIFDEAGRGAPEKPLTIGINDERDQTSAWTIPPRAGLPIPESVRGDCSNGLGRRRVTVSANKTRS